MYYQFGKPMIVEVLIVVTEKAKEMVAGRVKVDRKKDLLLYRTFHSLRTSRRTSQAAF